MRCRRRSFFRSSSLWLLGMAALAAPASAQLALAPRAVTLQDKSSVEVEAGELVVPESRLHPGTRRITLPVYRLRSTSPAPAAPIVLLAGGPGSSWIDQFTYDENFREVMFYRSIADVVLFDQRGGGHSQPPLSCPGRGELSVDTLHDRQQVRATLRAAVAACRDRWLNAGVDLAAYNTVENAADVHDLCLALGYRRVTLIGGSYGSHLALQVMRQYPGMVDRAVLFGVEGPDHTWDSPSAMRHTLERIAASAEQAVELAGRVPPGGFMAALERIVASIEREPRTVTVTAGQESFTVVVDAAMLRRAIAVNAGRRSAAALWPEQILALDRGDFSMPAILALRRRGFQLPDPVHFSMDCASGISDERRRAYEHDPAVRLLGDINEEYGMFCDLWPAADLGPAFHDNVVSDVPALVVQGTWDMSTPLENAREVAASLTNSRLVEIVGGGHGALYNMYEHWPPAYDNMRSFLAGGRADFPATITLDDIDFSRSGR